MKRARPTIVRGSLCALGVALLLPSHAAAQPTASPAPAAASAVELELARSRALRAPSDAEGHAAVEIYLNGLGRELGLGDAEQVERAARAVDGMVALHCSGADAPSISFCPKLPTAACRLANRAADLRMAAAIRSNEASANLAAAEAYRALFVRARAATPPPNGRGENDCAPLDQTLLNAATAYRRAGRRAAAIGMLREIDSSAPYARLRPTTFAMLGQMYFDIGMFDLAADSFEHLSTEAPNDVQALDGLENAIRLRMALGDAPRAARNLDRFHKLYGSSRVLPTAELTLWLAERVTESEQRGNEPMPSAEISALVERAVDLATHTNDPGLMLRSHTLAARRLLGHDAAAARRHAEAVVQLAHAGALARLAQQAQSSGGFGALGRVLTAVGEAQFLLATMKARSQSAQAVPTLPRQRTRAAIAAFLKTRLDPWIERRRAKLESTEQSYRPIVELEPVPPPRWVVAASGEIALGWIGLQQEIAAVASDLAATGDRELAQALRQSTEPVTVRAKAAARSYLGLRAKLQVTTEHGPQIERWLAQTFPRELPPIEELVPVPHWTPRELRSEPILEQPPPQPAP
jgi:hypothetical protein